METLDAVHFQEHLRRQLLIEKPLVVVETGIQTGVSTDRILQALVENNKGILFSIDPSLDKINAVFKALAPEQRSRWYPRADLSVDALWNLSTTEPWDVFLHDSDHNVACQTYEFEMAWRMVRPGGLICADDYTWSDHGAWQDFCARHKVMSDTMGAMAWVRKPLGTDCATSREEIMLAHEFSRTLARAKSGFDPDLPIVAVSQDGIKSTY